MGFVGHEPEGAAAASAPPSGRGDLARGPLLVLSPLTAWFGLVFIDSAPLTLPGRAAILGPYGLLLALLLLTLAAYLRRWRAAPFIALPLLLAWGTLQWLAHWRRVLQPPPAESVASYNAFFRGTWRIFPESPGRVVPDLFHTVLGALILLALVTVAADLVRAARRPRHHGAAAPGG